MQLVYTIMYIYIVDMAQHVDTATIKSPKSPMVGSFHFRQVHMHCYGGVDEDAAGGVNPRRLHSTITPHQEFNV